MKRVSKSVVRTLIIFAAVFIGSAFAQGSPNVPLLKQLNSYAGTGYNDCWGYIDAQGREYALLGVKSGTSIVDITDAANAQEVTFIGSAFSTWKDIKTYQHYAYTMTEASKVLQIIDLSNLPTSATLVNSFTLNTSGNPHNIYIDTDAAILYVSDDFRFNTSVHVYSLADPVNPVALTQFGPDSHDMYAKNGVLYIAEGSQPSIGIYDVTNPASPSLIHRITIPSAGYVHNVWPTEDQNFVMSTEETFGKTVKFWDISTPTNPILRDTYLAPNQLAHNTHIKGNYAYISHYESGLRIVDISDPDNIFEAGFYDTADAWGAYPFFPSGKVLISDISAGLYIVYFEGSVEQSSFTANVREGWNLIGLPFHASDSSVSALFPNHIPGTLYSFDGNYQTESELTPGVGYWLRFPAAEAVSVAGDAIETLSISLNEGWNMISGISCDVSLSSVSDPGNVIIPGTLYEFDGSYQLTDTIGEGSGHWIRASAAGTIELSCASGDLPKIAADPNAELAGFGKLTFSEIGGAHSQELFLGENLPETADFRSYSLPPQFIDNNGFDARFTGDMRIAAGENAEITVTSKRAVSVQISDWQMDDVVVQINRNGEQIQELPLQNGQQLQLGAGVSQLRIFKNSSAVPNQFEVFQNYPNPFNPVTEIRYQLPERSTVEIAIFNALGQKVKTLLSQAQEAGSHRIAWDATNDSGDIVSSGVYFYRVSAGSVSEMKRMVLLR